MTKPKETLDINFTKQGEPFSVVIASKLGNVSSDKWMSGLTCLELNFSVFKIVKESCKFELDKPIVEKERQNYLKILKVDDKNFDPEDIIAEKIGPFVIDRPNES